MRNVIHAVCVAVIVTASGVGTVSADVGCLDDSIIVSWGLDNVVKDTPTGRDFAAMAAGAKNSLALKTEGSLVSWGHDSYNVVTDTPTGTGFTAVAAGASHGHALKTDGALVSWGNDNFNQVGGTPTGTGFAAVAAGNQHVLALKTDGSLVAWGSDFQGGGQVSDTPTGTGFAAVAAGDFHSLALKTDGSLVSWGMDASGQVGNTPVGTGFAAVAAGSFFSFALKTDGSLVAWGEDYDPGVVSNTPVGTGFAAVAGGDKHGLALKIDGSLVSWGSDVQDQVRGTPLAGYFLDIATGESHSLALKARDEYEDLIVTTTGTKALLQRDVNVSGNATIDTTMTLENNPTLNIDGELIVTANAALTGSGAVSCDTVRLQGATFDTTDLGVEPAWIVGNGAFNGAFQGDAVTTDGGDLTVGDSNDYAGFHAELVVAVGVNTLTTESKGFASLGISTTLNGGTLVATTAERGVESLIQACPPISPQNAVAHAECEFGCKHSALPA
jgi:hypothetical protein